VPVGGLVEASGKFVALFVREANVLEEHTGWARVRRLRRTTGTGVPAVG
jgi:hypothetical protein